MFYALEVCFAFLSIFIVYIWFNSKSTKNKQPQCEIISTPVKKVQFINSSGSFYKEPIIEKENKIKPVLDFRSPILADRLDKLETASKGWKNRVEPTDAVKFSVAGRMGLNIEKSKSLILSPQLLSVGAASSPSDRKKKCPTPTRFKSKKDGYSQKDVGTNFKRSISAPGGPDQDLASEAQTPPAASVVGPSVLVPRADDETFTSFFESVSVKKMDTVDLGNVDLDEVIGQAAPMLVSRRNVQRVQRKRIGSKNPLKALAARTDIQDSYVQVTTGLAEKELKRIRVEKFSKGSLAVEALAGLASKEDFTAVNLKKASSPNFSMLPYKSLMLIHVKGRRHVQCRLVEPIYTNINRGDNYILVTPNAIYNYVGIYSNVIEKSRGAEVAMHIQQKKDLGTNASQVYTVCEDKLSCSNKDVQNFWKLLGSPNGEPSSIVNAGHPDEDELYESGIIDTNMIYELQDNELVPIDEYWGCIPKIEMLDPSKVIVFDFGSEMYVWNGKNVSLDNRKIALQLAKELWAEGYDYTECDICPLTVAQVLGDCNHSSLPSYKANVRPEWALLAKITQHMETILFREKFLDWPDFSRIIRVKEDDTDKHADGSIDIKPCDAKIMYNAEYNEPSLQLENSQLGRGTSHSDPDNSRHYEIKTVKITAWHVQEYEYEELKKETIGHFYAGNSYIVRWQYIMTVTGRDLNGKISRHSLSGRERCAYFCWQGRDASANEKGAAALLTVELDYERGPQVRVTQGYEPPAFINLFNGEMIIHSGKKYERSSTPWRLYLCRGNLENECVLIQVPCSMRQLRSRGSLILINIETNNIFLWHGARSLKHTKQVAKVAALKIQSKKSIEIFSPNESKVSLTEITEGNEPSVFFEALDGCNRNLYISLIKSTNSFEYTPRLFHLTSVSGKFESTEILSPLRHAKLNTPYPFLQSELYSVSQPAIFLLDNGSALWLWQGWWPERDVSPDSPPDSLTGSDQTGSGAVRWQAERRAAMQTAVDYWEVKHGKQSEIKGHLVWAGLEPLEFTSLFPIWIDRDDIAEINIRDGKKPGEPTTILGELSRLTRSTYHPSILLQRPLPEGVDPTRLELYLEPNHFQELLGMSKEEFEAIPTWKQTNVKKDIGLF